MTEPSGARAGKMPATMWTLVLTARDLGNSDGASALARLCEVYWYPLYVFIRRQGHDHHAAEDLTQSFFEHLFSQDWLQSVTQDKGKFRTFLLAALSHFLRNEWQKRTALKRGGAVSGFVSWDAAVAESRHRGEPAIHADPMGEYDCLWACALVERSLGLLKREYERCGKARVFAELSPWMTRPVPAGKVAEWAATLGMGEGALRVARHRLAQRFGQVLRGEVAQTVRDPADVDEELRSVLAAWSRQGGQGPVLAPSAAEGT